MLSEKTSLMGQGQSSCFGRLGDAAGHIVERTPLKPRWSIAAQAIQALVMVAGIVGTQVDSDSAIVRGLNDHLSYFSERLPEMTVCAAFFAFQSLSNAFAAACCSLPGVNECKASRDDISQLACFLIAVGTLIDFGAHPAHRQAVQDSLASNSDMPLSAAIVMSTQTLVNLLSIFQAHERLSCASKTVRGAIRAFGLEGVARSVHAGCSMLFSCLRRESVEHEAGVQFTHESLLGIGS